MMRAVLVASVISLGAFAAPGRAETITFEREIVGIPPSDFDSWGTGNTGPGRWAG
jgi:hypothetical protein